MKKIVRSLQMALDIVSDVICKLFDLDLYLTQVSSCIYLSKMRCGIMALLLEWKTLIHSRLCSIQNKRIVDLDTEPKSGLDPGSTEPVSQYSTYIGSKFVLHTKQKYRQPRYRAKKWP